jgi:hypothetical protein
VCVCKWCTNIDYPALLDRKVGRDKVMDLLFPALDWAEEGHWSDIGLLISPWSELNKESTWSSESRSQYVW